MFAFTDLRGFSKDIFEFFSKLHSGVHLAGAPGQFKKLKTPSKRYQQHSLEGFQNYFKRDMRGSH